MIYPVNGGGQRKGDGEKGAKEDIKITDPVWYLSGRGYSPSTLESGWKPEENKMALYFSSKHFYSSRSKINLAVCDQDGEQREEEVQGCCSFVCFLSTEATICRNVKLLKCLVSLKPCQQIHQIMTK